METIHIAAKYHQVGIAKKENKESVLSKWIAQISPSDEDLRINHFGIVSFALIFQACVGSIACALLLANGLNNVWFIACVGTTMAILVTILGQSPTRWVLRAFYVASIVNFIIIIYCLL
ncbi:MAG: hypothetical protein ABI199_05510 [Bacteroidia bacterium]